MVVELSNGVIEAVVLSQAMLIDPSVTIVIEQLSVKIVSDSATILYFCNHISDGFPGELSVCLLALVQMSVNVEKRGIHVLVVELVGNAESEWSEFSSFLDDGVHEAQCKDK